MEGHPHGLVRASIRYSQPRPLRSNLAVRLVPKRRAFSLRLRKRGRSRSRCPLRPVRALARCRAQALPPCHDCSGHQDRRNRSATQARHAEADVAREPHDAGAAAARAVTTRDQSEVSATESSVLRICVLARLLGRVFFEALVCLGNWSLQLAWAKLLRLSITRDNLIIEEMVKRRAVPIRATRLDTAACSAHRYSLLPAPLCE
mmetsp:Transcript_75509/g.219347  ORF Transcript_75509/g.219347 Transcript_75509/m.219347 type:complete len:204 (-) Transcript_75509:40-651(-)